MCPVFSSILGREQLQNKNLLKGFQSLGHSLHSLPFKQPNNFFLHYLYFISYIYYNLHNKSII